MSFARKIQRNARREAQKQARVDARAGVLVPGLNPCREAALKIAHQLNKPLTISVGPVSVFMLDGSDIAGAVNRIPESSSDVCEVVEKFDQWPGLVVIFAYRARAVGIEPCMKIGGWMTDEQQAFVREEINSIQWEM